MEHIKPKYTREASMQPTREAKSIKKLRGIQCSVDRHWFGASERRLAPVYVSSRGEEAHHG
jgi:hypothetical protein